ncbi:MAG: hypothetical protein U0103_06320 [Candidatus Obscuribacterales bacterium]
MRLTKGLIVACLMFGLPAASLAAKFNQDDLFKTVSSQSQSKTVTPVSSPTPVPNSNAAGAFASTVSSIKDADKKTKARKFLPIANAKIAEEPNNAQYYFARAQIYRDLEDYSSALKDINCALRLGPNNDRYFALRSAIFSGLENNSAALDDVEKALLLGKPTSELLEARAGDLIVLGRNQEAISAGSRAVEFNPRSSRAYAIRGVAKFKLKDYVGAEADCKQAESLGSGDAMTIELRRLLGEIRK